MTKLTELIEQAKLKVAAMTPEEREAMWVAQRESWVRAEASWGDEGTRVVDRLTAQGGDTELQQADAAHHAETELHDGGTGVGPWSLPPVEAPAPRAEAAPDEIAKVAQNLQRIENEWTKNQFLSGEEQRQLLEIAQFFRLRRPQPATMGGGSRRLCECHQGPTRRLRPSWLKRR